MGFTPEELQAARDRLVPDVAASGLRVLFCGINPGLLSAATGHHFARPGNRFWPVLYASGFTPRVFRPAEQEELLAHGVGITNVVARATAKADELTAEELREGGRLLAEKVARLRPRRLAVAGITAYRIAFDDKHATSGPRNAPWATPVSGHCPTPAASTRIGRPPPWRRNTAGCARQRSPSTEAAFAEHS